MPSASDSSPVVGHHGGTGASEWRAPPEAQTSGSVVRNSMILLPVDGDIGRNTPADNADRPSNVPVVIKQGGEDTQQGNTAMVETRLAPENVSSLADTEHAHAQDTPTLTPRLAKEMTAVDDRLGGGYGVVVQDEDISGAQLASTEPAEPVTVKASINCERQCSEAEQTVEAQNMPVVNQEISPSITVTARTEDAQDGESVVVAETERAHAEDMSTLTAGLTKEVSTVDDRIEDEHGVIVQDEDVSRTQLACMEEAEPAMLETRIDGVGQSSGAGQTNMPLVEQEISTSTAVPARTEVAHDGASSCKLVDEQDASLRKPAAMDSYAAEPTTLTTAEPRVNGTLDGMNQSLVAESATDQGGNDISRLGISSCSAVKQTENDGEQIASDEQPLHSMRTNNMEGTSGGRKYPTHEKDETTVMNDEDEVGWALSRSAGETFDFSTPEEEGGTNKQRDQDAFLPSATFTGGKQGYVFRLGDCGLGFYTDGYVDRPTNESQIPTRRPWNAGPGDEAVRRGPIGPILKPFKNTRALQICTDKQREAAEESDMRPFMARMVAQRNSRAFQTTLLDRERVLDAHILSLLEKFNDPTFFKKKHGYNVHGQMLGRDGKMIIKLPVEKTEEEKAKLSWYRKVYEDRLGKHLPSKRLGDSIEARREAYAYSRYFTAELDERQKELNKSLEHALEGVTKIEFVTEDYHYPGAYDTDGKVILEKGAPISNELHQTEEQKERACSYRFKAIQRYHAAHEDIANAILKKDKALQKMFKKTDPSILQEIAEETVQSSGMDLYRQKKIKGAVDNGPEAGSSRTVTGGLTESPEQLRDTFAKLLKAQIKNKDKALMKEVAAFAEEDAEQMIEGFGKGVEIFPDSWREDRANLKRMQKRRKELVTEIEADRRKTVCPWRPGGLHIAQEPWQSFLPRDHRPPVRSASEGQAVTGREVANETESAGTQGAVGQETMRESKGGGTRAGKCAVGDGGPQRPHTAPTPRKRDFMDKISIRARRILAAQQPGTPLHSAFSAYSNDPFPLECTQRSHRGLAPPLTGRAVGDFSPPGSRTEHSWTIVGEGSKHAWAEVSGSVSAADRSLTSTMRYHNGIPRPHSAVPEAPRRVFISKRRPLTACGIRNPGSANASSVSGPATARVSEGSSRSWREETVDAIDDQHGKDAESRDLRLQGGTGITVLCSRLCGPSDLVYKRAAWPSRPEGSATSQPCRRKARAARKVAKDPVVVPRPCPDGRDNESDGMDRAVTTFDTTCNEQKGVGNELKVEKERAPSAALHVLEERLSTSSWRRVNQRRKVFRGYSDRSRRERIWDPGSAFYANGASRHHGSAPRAGGLGSGRGDKSRVCYGRTCAMGEGGRERRHRRRRVSAEVEGPVDMDWNKVDTKLLSEAVDGMKIQLEDKLFAVVANDEGGANLDECFREAREILDAAGNLLGWPYILRERFKKKFGGNCRIGNYVATVARVSLLWTALSGLIEILHMLGRRKDLLEESWNATTPAATNKSSCPSTGEPPKHEPIDVESADLQSNATAESRREDRMRAFEKRLEIAEYSIAIAESVKLWLAYVPWRVNVLWDGTDVLSRLGAEEEMLLWPPDPEPNVDNEAPAQAEQCLGDSRVGPMPLEACDSRGPVVSAHGITPGPDDESSCRNAENTERAAEEKCI